MSETITKIKKTPVIHMNTLDDVMNHIKMVGEAVIIDAAYGIEIYDGYRE